MENFLNYSLVDGVATIELADGGSNLLSPGMIEAVNKALDKAEREATAVVLSGAGNIFSGGFDLKVMKSGAMPALKMLMGGFETVYRLVNLPMPLVVASNGHTVAAGVFLLFAGDYRFVTRGDFKIVLNEVEIGMTMPYTALAIARYRLSIKAFEQVINHARVYCPSEAVEAGFADQAVDSKELIQNASEKAKELANLNAKAFRKTKLRARKKLTRSIRWAVIKDFLDLIGQGFIETTKTSRNR